MTDIPPFAPFAPAATSMPAFAPVAESVPASAQFPAEDNAMMLATLHLIVRRRLIVHNLLFNSARGLWEVNLRDHEKCWNFGSGATPGDALNNAFSNVNLKPAAGPYAKVGA